MDEAQGAENSFQVCRIWNKNRKSIGNFYLRFYELAKVHNWNKNNWTIWRFLSCLKLFKTSRDRPKSAPYLRLKNTKRTWQCQSILFYSTRKFFESLTMPKKTERVDPLGVFNIHSVAKHQKIYGEGDFYFRKKSHNAEKKLKGGTLWDFSISILSQNSKKNWRGTLWEKNFPKKVSQCRKNWKGVSPGMVCYAGKQEKPFWFSSLGQMVHFGAIIFCRTFVELFWSVQVVLKPEPHMR